MYSKALVSNAVVVIDLLCKSSCDQECGLDLLFNVTDFTSLGISQESKMLQNQIQLGKDGRLGFSEKYRKRIWKNHIDEIINKENDWTM